MNIRAVQMPAFTVVGIRASGTMSGLGAPVRQAYVDLLRRREDIRNVNDPGTVYGVSPPNYKGNPGPLDFYVCLEVDPIANVPHGMVHLHLVPHLYAEAVYRGPEKRKVEAYDATSRWMRENGYVYDDVTYYFERYGERTKLLDPDDEDNEVLVYCPIRRKEEGSE
ncbi:GyrI-like domain-containing protein [Paenibacillus flagellatus]|uniref:AraC family transcriptional regulator n=1 Tax=Paenibacillus flagellatus TaxID=2211139 RepID=A0A2V5KXQ6_9BACL|nr:GyrI-like domain-containing protein [Paenibacillus flagellatus]PYI57277.1 AraC family transcriptional regulator [Paenibacillus flagellatus]